MKSSICLKVPTANGGVRRGRGALAAGRGGVARWGTHGARPLPGGLPTSQEHWAGKVHTKAHTAAYRKC